MKSKIYLIAIGLALTAFLTSCASPDPYVRGGQRRGTVAGGVTGAIIGNNVRGINSWEGAAIGAAVGRMAGGSRARRTQAYYGYGRPRYYD